MGCVKLTAITAAVPPKNVDCRRVGVALMTIVAVVVGFMLLLEALLEDDFDDILFDIRCS
jgi:hypothetical protein